MTSSSSVVDGPPGRLNPAGTLDESPSPSGAASEPVKVVGRAGRYPNSSAYLVLRLAAALAFKLPPA